MFVLLFLNLPVKIANMNLFVKLAAYLAVISYFERCLASPISDQKNVQPDTEPVHVSMNEQDSSMKILQRVRKQDPVVQPEWTSDQEYGSLFTDYNVRVTDKKLEETEAIRDIIQGTVENDTYVVELDESDFKEEELDSKDDSERSAEPKAEENPEPEPEPKPKPIIETEKHEKITTKERTTGSTNSSKKSKKRAEELVSHPFLTWLKQIFAFHWGAKS